MKNSFILIYAEADPPNILTIISIESMERVPLGDECYILADILVFFFNLLYVFPIDHQKVDLRELDSSFDLSSDEFLNIFLYKLPRLSIYFFNGAMKFFFVLLSKVERSRFKYISLFDLFILVHRNFSRRFFCWTLFLALLTLVNRLLRLHLRFIGELVIIDSI